MELNDLINELIGFKYEKEWFEFKEKRTDLYNQSFFIVFNFLKAFNLKILILWKY